MEVDGKIHDELVLLGERIDDLHRSLGGFDSNRLGTWNRALPHFQQLSQQLALLRDRDNFLFDHYAVLPRALTPESGLIPHLLSTRLEKEQEDEMGSNAITSTNKRQRTVTQDDIKQHNAVLSATCDRVAERIRSGAPRGAESRSLSTGPSTTQAQPSASATRVEPPYNRLHIIRPGGPEANLMSWFLTGPQKKET